MLKFESIHPASLDLAVHYRVDDFQTLADYIQVEYNRTGSISKVVDRISKLDYGKLDTRAIDWTALVLGIVSKKPEMVTGDFHGVYLYQEEIDELRKVDSEEARKFLYLALIVHKWNNHPSGWVKYERDDFFKFWGLKDLKKAEKEQLAQIATAHGLELRVIGQKNPTVCYNVSFRKDCGEIVAMYDNDAQIKEWWDWLGL